MIRCSEQLISEYVDGDLPTAIARELEDHICICADCRALLLEYYSLVSASHLLAARTDETGRDERRGLKIRHPAGFGQARSSNLLA